MSYHDMRTLRAEPALVPQSLEAFLLDQCRCFAAARQTGSALPLDRAFEALSCLMPSDKACTLFGALHCLVSALAQTPQAGMTWYPPSCRRASPGEMHLLAALSQAHDRPPVGVEPLAVAPVLVALDLLRAALLGAGLLPEAPPLPERVIALSSTIAIGRAA